MTTAQAHRATADTLQAAWDAADQDARDAKRAMTDARRRAQRARQAQATLEHEAARLGLELVISHRPQPERT